MWKTQAGRFSEADAILAERREIAIAIDNPTVLGATAPVAFLLSAWRGDVEQTRAGAGELIHEARARGQAKVVDCALSALTVLELGEGAYETALAAAREVFEEDSPFLGSRLLPDLIEAASRCQESEIASAGFERLAARAPASRSNVALGLLARSRALLSEEGEEELYREALRRLGATDAVPERGARISCWRMVAKPSAAVATRASSCAWRLGCSSRSARSALSSAPPPSCWRRVSGCAAARRQPATF